MSDCLRTYLLEQIAAWALARAAAAEDAAARLAADRAVLIAQRDALARKLAEAERRARFAGAALELMPALFDALVPAAAAALPLSVLPIVLEEPTYRHAVRVALPGWIDRLELSVKP